MRIFKNLDEMYKEVERELLHNGLVSQSSTVQDKDVHDNDDFMMKELIGFSYLVSDTSDKDQWLQDRGGSLQWANTDFTERIRPSINPGEAYKIRPVWEEFLHDGKFAYTYSERMTGKISQVIDLLQNKANTRQAVISIYNPDIDDARRGGKMRVPCSMYYQFIARDGKLDVIYNMRSCDFAEHMPYDVWHAAKLRDLIAEQVGLKPGDLIHFIGSLHAFKKDKREIF